MQNFNNTEWKNYTENDMFEEHLTLVYGTIKRKFSNHNTFCKAHFLDYDDLVQMGSLGLLKAIRNYNEELGVKFQTHAINHIVWEINSQAMSDSLRTMSNRSFDIVDCISGDAEVSQSDSDGADKQTVLDFVPAPESNGFEAVEDSLLEEEVIKFLEKDEEVDEIMLKIFVGKIKGKSIESIADELGIHRNSALERLRTRKASRIKNRLAEFMKVGA